MLTDFEQHLDTIRNRTQDELLRLLKQPPDAFRFEIENIQRGDTCRFEHTLVEPGQPERPAPMSALLYDLTLQLWEHHMYDGDGEWVQACYHFHRDDDGNYHNSLTVRF